MGFPSTNSIFSWTWRFALVLASVAPAVSPGQDLPGNRVLGKPVPKPGWFSATKGVPMPITLAAEVDSPVSVVEFLIREFPRNGDISVLHSLPNDRSKARLTYTARRNTAAATDYFTFAARYPGGLYSKPVRVEIALQDLEPFIKAPDRVEFGRVMVGRSQEKEIYIQNTGNAAYQNKIALSPPWFLLEPADGDLNLSPGSGQLLRVRFTPAAAGPSETELLFNRNPGGASFLEGAGFNPFTLKTPQVVLRWEPKSRTRLGEISIESHSPQVLPVMLDFDPRLKVSGGAAQFLEPDKTADLRLYLPSSDTHAFEGRVEIAFGAYSETFQVVAHDPPAHFVIDPTGHPDDILDFGQVEAGKVALQSFQLRNIGGSAGEVRFVTNPPYSVMANSGRAALGPQQAEAFAVRFSAPQTYAGPFGGELKIEAGNGQTLKLQMNASVAPPERAIAQGIPDLATALGTGAPPRPPAFPPAADPDSDPDPDLPPDPGRLGTTGPLALEELEAMRSPLGFVTFPTVERDISESIPEVDSSTLKLEEEGRQQLVVSWPLNRDDLTDYEIEMRMNRMTAESSLLESVWAPHHDVDYRQAGDRIVARIGGLSPNRTYEFRLFTLGNVGKVSAPAMFAVTTKTPRDWTWIYAGCGVVLLAGISWLVWRRSSAQLSALE